jgi:hypothetical protein
MHIVQQNQNLEIFEYQFPGKIIRDILNKPGNVKGWI